MTVFQYQESMNVDEYSSMANIENTHWWFSLMRVMESGLLVLYHIENYE